MNPADKNIAGEKRRLLLVLSATAFLWPFLTAGANIALPAIAAEYNVDAVRISWVTNVTLLFTATFLLPSGKLCNALGGRRMLLSGVGIAVLSTLVVVFAKTYATLLALRAVQGVGAALISTSGMTFITSEFEYRQRGFAMGVYTAAVYLGLSTGPFLGGFLVSLFGWRGVFYFVALVAFATYLQARKLLPRIDVRPYMPKNFDFLGSIIYAFGLGLIVLGMDKLDRFFWAVVTASGVVVVFLFLLYERFAKEPVFDVKLFRGNRPFAFSCLACLISYSAIYAVAYLLSLYLQHARGLTPRVAGVVMIVQPLVQMVLSPLSGKLSSKVEPGVIASIGMGVTALGTFILIWLNKETGIAYIMVASAVLGIGIGLFSAPNSNSIMSGVAPEHRGVAAGMMGSLRMVGQLFSMVTVTIVFSLIMGHVDVTEQTLPSFLSSVRFSFAAMTLLCAISVVFSATRGKMKAQ